MFGVVYDPPAADHLALFLSGHGCRAWKRTPFVVEIDASANEGKVSGSSPNGMLLEMTLRPN